MRMEFRRLPAGDLLVLGHDHTPTQIREVLDEFLESEGVDAWEADNVAPTATFSRTWLSPTMGFTHDCAQHSEQTYPGCSDSEPVTVVRVAVTG